MKYFLILAMACFSACTYLEDYPVEPELSYRGYKVDESVENNIYPIRIKMGLVDGDGDIGLYNDGADENAPKDLVIKRYKLVDGEFVILSLPDYPYDSTYYKISGDLQPTGQNKVLIADLDYRDEIAGANDFEAMRYAFYLTDRAGNKSNTVVTDTIRYKIPTDDFVEP